MRRWVLVALLLLSCSAPRPAPSSPATAADPSFEARAMVGQVLAGLLTGLTGSVEDPALERYVSEVGWRVARASGGEHVKWQFHVIDTAEPSASSMVGGQVMISRGLLVHLGSEAELAAVLGHEIGHVMAGHTERSLLRLAESDEDRVWDQELERDEERQADALAVRYLARAGYRPEAMLDMLRALYRAADVEPRCNDTPNHPDLPTRLARAALVASGEPRAGELGRDRFVSHLEGTVVGPQSDTFACQGRELLLPREGWVFGLPAGWTWKAEGGQISAANADETQAMIAMRVPGRSSDLYPRALAQTLRQRPFSVTQLLGHRATTGRLPNKSGTVSSATLIDLDASSWMFASTRTGGSDHETLMRGLRRWDPKRDLVPARPRLTLMRVAKATTLASLGSRCGSDGVQLERLNGVSADAHISQGRLLKCVRISRRSRR